MRKYPERNTVRCHHRLIFQLRRPTYAGMPFFDNWNPDKGGSFNAGAQWIIENLGHRPAGNYQLHIVDRRAGFTPGNLEWVPREKHRQSEMIDRLLLEIQRRDEFDEDGKDPEPAEVVITETNPARRES
ncbi:MAG: hypothetical protein ACRDHZ_13460 [Ktedonobacteraceae bacterium]